MSDTVLVPGGRDVRATLDVAEVRSDTEASIADAVVVACPPHPQHRGHRGDERLVAVSDALTGQGIDCLRFDYGPWDEGYGECTDADDAIGWALERYDRVGLFGFSFGGTVALVTAASNSAVDGVCALAPTARLNRDTDAVVALEELAARGDPSIGPTPACVLYATRDTTADWKPVVERAEALGIGTVAFETDHFFIGRAGDVAESIAGTMQPWLTA